MTSGRRWLAALGAVGLAAIASNVQPAAACSCAIEDPRAVLARADAAFVGTLVERRDTRSGPVVSTADPVTLVFRVERRVKGALGKTLQVRTAAESASCGIEAKVGEQMGLFLVRDGVEWTSNLCLQIQPAKLLAAARPLPSPTGRGPVAMLVGGGFGDVRTLALDRAGRTLAYGRGRGQTRLVAPCPGGRTAAEVVYVQNDVFVAVRELRRFRVLRERRLALPSPPPRPTAVSCADSLAREVFVFAGEEVATGARASLLRVTSRAAVEIWSGTAVAASLDRDRAYLSAGVRGDRAVSFDLRARRETVLARVPQFTGPLVPSADRRALAGVAYHALLARNPPPPRLVLVDIRRGAPRVRSVALPSQTNGEVRWLGNGRVVFFPTEGRDDHVRIYDRALRVTSGFRRWRARRATIVGGRAFGLGWAGQIIAARLPRGPVERVGELPGPVAHAIVAVPGSNRSR